MWPFSIEDIPSKGLFNGKTEIDPLVHDLIDKVHHLLKQHFIDKKSYLSLSSTDRATQYQHALKALGEDITDSSVLEPELKIDFFWLIPLIIKREMPLKRLIL